MREEYKQAFRGQGCARTGTSSMMSGGSKRRRDLVLLMDAFSDRISDGK